MWERCRDSVDSPSVRVHLAGAEDRERFNAFVATSPHCDILQSWEWGEVKRRTGWRALRLLAEREGDPVAACSLLWRRPVRGIPAVVYAPRGPVLDFADAGALEATIDAVRSNSAGAFVLICDPAIPPRGKEAAALRAAGFRAATRGGIGGVQPKAVMVLDLTPDPDEIFGAFKSKWRYNIRLAERRGVAVREGARADLPVFYEILLETARRDGFFVRGRSYFETLWDVLEPPGMLQTFLAEHDGRPIAGIMLFCFGDRAMYTYGASSNEHRNVMPNHLLQWHAIRWARERGYRVYDFRGVSPVRDGRPVEDHLAGLNRFKEGFGARYVEYAGQLELPLRSGWYGLWRAAGPAAMAAMRKIKGAGAVEAD